jgi:hypothetical protein
MQSYVTSTRDGVYDETQTFRRRRGSLFYDGRTRNGSAFDIRSRPSLSEGLLPEQGSGKSLQRGLRLPDGLLGELMVAGTAVEIRIVGTAGAAIFSLWRGAAACNEYK